MPFIANDAFLGLYCSVACSDSASRFPAVMPLFPKTLLILVTSLVTIVCYYNTILSITISTFMPFWFSWSYASMTREQSAQVSLSSVPVCVSLSTWWFSLIGIHIEWRYLLVSRVCWPVGYGSFMRSRSQLLALFTLSCLLWSIWLSFTFWRSFVLLLYLSVSLSV